MSKKIGLVCLLILVLVSYFLSKKTGETIDVVISISPTPSLIKSPEEEKCINAGGKWRSMGLNKTPVCNLKTNDAGKACSGRSDCEGACLSTGEESKTRRGMTGKCSEYKINLGCNSTIEGGMVVNVCAD